MVRKAVSFGGALVLAAAVLLLTATPVQAHGGGISWGGRHGGFYIGSSPYYGYSHGYYPGYYGYSGYARGYYPYYGYSRGVYPYYGYARGVYPYYGYASGYYPYYGYTYSYPYSTYSLPMYGSGYYGSYAALTPSYSSSYQSFYPSTTTGQSTASTQPPNSARVRVTVPAGAEVWFDDTKTTTTGTVRDYVTPSLPTDKKYGYDIKARWMENGREVTQKQHVDVSAGADVQVQFPLENAKPAETKTETDKPPVSDKP